MGFSRRFTYPGPFQERLESTSLAPISYPCTFSCWYYHLNTENDYVTLMNTYTGLANGAGLRLFVRAIDTDPVSPDAVTMSVWDGSALNNQANSTSTISTNTWHHCCGTVNATGHPTIYLDGGNSATDATFDNPNVSSASAGFALGIMDRGGIRWWCNGDIALPAIWDVELTAGEVASLAKGVWPTLVRPASLTSFWPFTGETSSSNAKDVIGGFTLTDTGGVLMVDNQPPTIQPSTQRLQFPAQGKIWVNDAPSYDAGAVQQTHPGTSWSDTSITISPIVDVTGLSGQLYLGVEKSDGAITWRAITLSGVLITSVSTDDNVLDNETDWVIAGGGFGAR